MVSIGIDIGGTNIAGGVVDASQKLTVKASTPFPGADRPAASIGAIAALIAELCNKAGVLLSDVDGVGLAVPGSIDYDRMAVIDAHNLGYHDFPLVSLLSDALQTDTPLCIENDANAAALAEYYCGAFRGAHSGLLITLGTGVGGGLILNDKIFIGGKKNGFEFGHAMLVFGGERCTCGNDGCIEAYCSATAIIREGRRAAAAHPESLIAVRCGGAPERIDAKLVIDCAKAGDPAAKAVFDAYTKYLGGAITTAIAAFDPELVAIGGGVSLAGDFLLDPVRAWVAPRAFFHNFGRIVPAEMHNDAGIVGAAMLHKQRA